MTRLTLPAVLTASLLAAAGWSGCAPTPPADDTRLRVVASTNVYGDIATQIAGEHADVVSIITTAAQDPHSYEATARDQLAIADADLVITNGGGYDPFMHTLIDASGNDDAVVLDAVEASDLIPAGEEHADDGHGHVEGFNEHVWYSFEAMDALASRLAEQLGAFDEAHADAFRANYDAFAANIADLEARAHDLHESVEGTGVAITEPVPLHLLAELGLHNQTPDEFSEAIEEGGDVPPLVLDETLQLFRTGNVALLAYNEQTASPETEQVRAAADDAGVPVVSFTETLPDGADYFSWMRDNIDAVASALT